MLEAYAFTGKITFLYGSGTKQGRHLRVLQDHESRGMSTQFDVTTLTFNKHRKAVYLHAG